MGQNEILANDIDLVMNADTVKRKRKDKLCFYFNLFQQVFVDILRADLNSTTNNTSSIYNIDTSIATMSYNELIRHFIITETQYKDDLELLIKFFRNPLRHCFDDDLKVCEFV